MKLEKKLLKTILELYDLSQDISQWSESYFIKNPPRFYRLKMIDSLLKALKIECSYMELIQGDFINDGNLPKINEIMEFIKNSNLKLKSDDPFNWDDAKHCFYFFMKYRLHLSKLENIDSGVYAASGFYLLPFKFFNQFSPYLNEMTEKIDGFLFLSINPDNISFSKEELIKKFDYPSVKMSDIDLDWI